jgi:hypothetical protein
VSNQPFQTEQNGRSAEFVFHHKGTPVGDFRKAWATAYVAAELGKMICPKCNAEGSERTCEHFTISAAQRRAT